MRGTGSSRRLRIGAVAAVAVAATLAGCGNSAGGGGGDDDANLEAISGETSTCGLGNGKKATGEPIVLGAIATKQPGLDFSDAPNMAQAYFDCVNENGGINGRPIDYRVELEQTDPGQVRALAKKLVETEQVVGMAGTFSIIDCAVNHTYYEQQNLYTINSGIAPECYSTPNSAPVNLGPRLSSVGATQHAIEQGAKKIAFVGPQNPVAGYVKEGVEAVAKAEGVPITALSETTPVQDANSLALKLVQAAGDGGAVVLNFTPPEALKVFQAAESQGLQKRVKWGCSTPCNTDFLASALGPEWDGQVSINAELNLIDAKGPDTNLYRKVREKYAPKVPLGSFSQFGFLMAKIAVDRMLTIEGDVTRESYNQAIVATKDFKSDLLCKPWYYGESPLHIPNNTPRTVTVKSNKIVEEAGCDDVSGADPLVARVREIEKQAGG